MAAYIHIPLSMRERENPVDKRALSASFRERLQTLLGEERGGAAASCARPGSTARR